MKHITPTAIKLVIASSRPLEAISCAALCDRELSPDDFLGRFGMRITVNFHNLAAAKADHAVGCIGQRGIVRNEHNRFAQPVF